MFKNFFKFSKEEESESSEALKPEVSNNEETNEEKVKEEIPKENKDPMAGMSLEEKLRVLEEKKAEIESLKDQRRNFYIDAKNLEEKMLALGLSEGKTKEIREQVLAEGGDVATQISDIRKAYGLEATPVEIYSSRLKDCEAEIERSKKALAMNYREVLKVVKGNKESHHQSNENLVMEHIHSELCRKGFDKTLPEITNLFISENFKVNEQNFLDKQEWQTAINQKVDELIKMLNEKISTESIYKTPGDIKKAEERLERLISIKTDIYELLDDAMEKKNRFFEEKK